MTEPCKHLRSIGDNYGTSCADCKEQLSGYGWGGWFGTRLSGAEVCIHVFSRVDHVCIYCEMPQIPEPVKAEEEK